MTSEENEVNNNKTDWRSIAQTCPANRTTEIALYNPPPYWFNCNGTGLKSRILRIFVQGKEREREREKRTKSRKKRKRKRNDGDLIHHQYLPPSAQNVSFSLFFSPFFPLLYSFCCTCLLISWHQKIGSIKISGGEVFCARRIRLSKVKKENPFTHPIHRTLPGNWPRFFFLFVPPLSQLNGSMVFVYYPIAFIYLS